MLTKADASLERRPDGGAPFLIEQPVHRLGAAWTIGDSTHIIKREPPWITEETAKMRNRTETEIGRRRILR